MTDTKETTSNKLSRTTLNFYSKELFEELEKTLGETFTNLTPRVKTGYAIVVTKHSKITKTNQHIKDPKSFHMPEEEVESYFNDRKIFRAVNNNGYFLAPSKKEKGAFTIKKKANENTTYHPPTNWIKKTVRAANGVNGRKGWNNGYQLSNELQQVASKIDSLSDTKLTLVNLKQQTIDEVVEDNGGSLFVTKSNTTTSHNLNLEVNINKQTLEQHKELVVEVGGEVWRLEQEEYKKQQAGNTKKHREKAGSRKVGREGRGP